MKPYDCCTYLLRDRRFCQKVNFCSIIGLFNRFFENSSFESHKMVLCILSYDFKIKDALIREICPKIDFGDNLKPPKMTTMS